MTSTGSANPLVGSYRRLGDLGPAYQVVGLDEAGMAHLVFLETGEELSLPVDEVASDPDISTSSVAPITDPQFLFAHPDGRRDQQSTS